MVLRLLAPSENAPHQRIVEITRKNTNVQTSKSRTRPEYDWEPHPHVVKLMEVCNETKQFKMTTVCSRNEHTNEQACGSDTENRESKKKHTHPSEGQRIQIMTKVDIATPKELRHKVCLQNCFKTYFRSCELFRNFTSCSTYFTDLPEE